MELTVLGSSGTWPAAGGVTSGFLVTTGETRVWLDAGTGTFARLQSLIDVGDLGAIVITHGHSDHFLDVIPAFYALHYGDLGASGLPFYSPEGFVVDQLSLLVSEHGRDVMREAYDFRTALPGEPFEVGPMRFTPFEMPHVGATALGYRIESDGAVIAYTGDTGPGPVVAELARDADLFLCEATYQDASEQHPFHLSARQAAEHAAEAGAGRLVLTHIVPTLDPEVSLAEASEVFDGPVELAREGVRWEVGV